MDGVELSPEAGAVIGDAPLWSVGVVAERLGLPAPTLRTWDRRYGVGPSERTDGGHRRYGAADRQRVAAMARLTSAGVPAHAAARVVLAMDAAQLDRTTRATSGASSVAPSPGDGVVEAICAAAIALDSSGLTTLYQRTLRADDLIRAWTDVLVPALQRIGEHWGSGALGVESEHLASELLVTELRALAQAERLQITSAHLRATAADLVLASADDEQHYLPLLALEVELARRGVGAAVLGPRMPHLAVVDLLTRRRPSRLFLWASLERGPDTTLWQAFQRHQHPLTVVLGGPGWPSEHPPVDRPVRIERPHDLESAVRALTR